MYGWSKKQATFYNGLILGGFGVFAVFIVIFSKILAKRFVLYALILNPHTKLIKKKPFKI